MMRLAEPIFTYEKMIDSCSDGITGNIAFLQRVRNGKALLLMAGELYAASASTGDLYSIPAIHNPRNITQIVIGQLTKSDLMKLYNSYLVVQDKPARTLYNSILVAANEKCPFCGGIGRPRNLDHYLPKAHYPQFSVLPINLVPSCRDCNMDGKGEGFARAEEEQIIHPYLDNECFFNEQWIFANYLAGEDSEPGVVEYFARPPEYWKDVHKQRAEKHFNDFSLDIRFSKEAGARIISLLPQISALNDLGLTMEEIKDTLIKPVIDSASFVNHWERVMHLALLDSL